MTTFASVPAAATLPVIAPATPFRRRALGVAAVVGGLLTAAGFATTVWETAPDKLSYLDSLVVDPIRSQVAAVLLSLGYLAIVPVLLALAAMTRTRGRVAGNIGFGLSIVGALQLPGLLVTDFYDLAIRQTLPAQQAVATSDAAQALPLAGLVGGPFVLGTFVGMTVLAVAAWRAGFFPLTATPLVAMGAVASFVLPVGPVQGLVQGALLGLFLLVTGVVALRMTDAEWVSGQRRREMGG